MALPLWAAGAFAKTAPAQSERAPKALAKAPEPTKSQSERIDDFVLANLVFLTLHEMGHALISELGLQVLGKEEETADRFAAFMMTQNRGMEELFKDAIAGWFARADRKKFDETEFWGRHNPDRKRALDAVCLLYGSDPPRFKPLADQYKMPKDEREPCYDDARINGQTWFEVLSPNMVAGNAEDRARVPPAGPDFIPIEYGESITYKAEREFLMKSAMLEEVRNGFRRNFMVQSGITLSAQECSEDNAFWRRSLRKLTICYELVRQYREMAVLQGDKN